MAVFGAAEGGLENFPSATGTNRFECGAFWGGEFIVVDIVVSPEDLIDDLEEGPHFKYIRTCNLPF